MVVRYNECGNCGHLSKDHDSSGKCKMRLCTCTEMKPKEVR